MNKKRQAAFATGLILIGLMMVACAAVLSLPWRSNSTVISRERFELINVGMTRSELEESLGRPRSEFGHPVYVWVPQRNGRQVSTKLSPTDAKPSFFPSAKATDAGCESVWLGKSGLIAVRFDERGRLREKYFSTVHDPGGGPSALDWLASRAGEVGRAVDGRED